MYPLLLEPPVKDYLWGGTRLKTDYHFKTDIFKRQMTYSTSKEIAANLVTVDASRVFEVIALNKKGIKPD